MSAAVIVGPIDKLLARSMGLNLVVYRTNSAHMTKSAKILAQIMHVQAAGLWMEERAALPVIEI